MIDLKEAKAYLEMIKNTSLPEGKEPAHTQIFRIDWMGGNDERAIIQMAHMIQYQQSFGKASKINYGEAIISTLPANTKYYCIEHKEEYHPYPSIMFKLGSLQD